MGIAQEGPFLVPQASNALDLLARLAYPGPRSLDLWDWKNGQKSGAVQERFKGSGPRWEGAHPPPSYRLLNGDSDTLKELLGWGGSTRELVGSFHRMKSGLGDVSPLLVYADREAQAVAVCYPSPTLDTF